MTIRPFDIAGQEPALADALMRYRGLDPVRAKQAAALGQLCRSAIRRASLTYGAFCTTNADPLVQHPCTRESWQKWCDEAELDAVAYARRAAWMVLA